MKKTALILLLAAFTISAQTNDLDDSRIMFTKQSILKASDILPEGVFSDVIDVLHVYSENINGTTIEKGSYKFFGQAISDTNVGVKIAYEERVSFVRKSEGNYMIEGGAPYSADKPAPVVKPVAKVSMFKNLTNGGTYKTGTLVNLSVKGSLHKIYINGVLKDTDGSAYTAYAIKTKGKVKVKAVVDGKSEEITVTIK